MAGDSPGRAAIARHELHRRGLRSVKRLVRPLWLQRLMRRNESSRESLLSPAGPVVSLTTFEPRWPIVHHTIESIGAGKLAATWISGCRVPVAEISTVMSPISAGTVT